MKHLKTFVDFTNESSRGDIPDGSDTSWAPWNEKDKNPRIKKPKNVGIEAVATAYNEFLWFSKDSELYELSYNTLTRAQIQEIDIDYAGNGYATKGEDNEPEFETDIDSANDIDDEDIIKWLNDNWDNLKHDNAIVKVDKEEAESTLALIHTDKKLKPVEKSQWLKVDLSNYKNTK